MLDFDSQAGGAGAPDEDNLEPPYLARAARAFDRACQLTGLSNSELCRRFTEILRRPRLLSRQTLAAWRSGHQAVPLAAFVVAANLAGLRLRVIFALGEEGFDLSLIPPEARIQDGVPLRYLSWLTNNPPDPIEPVSPEGQVPAC